MGLQLTVVNSAVELLLFYANDQHPRVSRAAQGAALFEESLMYLSTHRYVTHALARAHTNTHARALAHSLTRALSLTHSSAHRYSTAQSSLERAMRLQHPESFALMSWLLQHGREGIPVQLDIAHDFAKQGWRLGCEHSQGALANCFLNGWGVARNLSTAHKLAKESAAKGSKYGQFVFGIVNIRHPGSNKEDAATLALQNLKLASDQGLPEAHLCLADALITFDDGSKSVYTEVMRLYEQAAFSGVAAAHDLLGEMYEKGWGVAQDIEAAAKHYRRALQMSSSSESASRFSEAFPQPSSPAASASSRLQVASSAVSKLAGPSAVDSAAPPAASAPVSCDAAQVQERAAEAGGHEKKAEAAVKSDAAPAVVIPTVIQKLGKMLGNQFCPNCKQNATIGTKCTATGAYHMMR